GEDSDFKDSIDQSVLTHWDDLFVDPTPEMFIDEQPPDYSFPPRFDVYPDDFLEIDSDATFDDDSFDSEGGKIKEAELLIDPLDLPCDILSEYDSFNSQDFSRDDVLFSPDNEDKVLFNAEYESDSSYDQSCSDEDVLEKIVSKPLCEEEIIPKKSLRTHDSSLLISSKIDSLLEEFAGELTLLKSIPPGIDETDCDFEENIRLIEKLFDSLMEEIDLFCTSDYPMPPGIEDKDYDSKRDILIPKDLPSNNFLSFAEKESFHSDIPPFSRPSAKPPDGDTGILNIKMMGDVSDQKAFMHKLMITLAPHPHQEKSPDLLSHRCETVKIFNTHHSHLNKCPMLLHGQNTPPLDILLFHFYPP
nr:hypothetical protein [Tanacetum cinerariifolium]